MPNSDSEEDSSEEESDEPEEDEEEEERERLKQQSIQNDIDIILDIKKYVAITRRRISDTLFAPEPEKITPKVEEKPQKQKKKGKKSPVKVPERSYSIDGEADLVQQAMRILEEKDDQRGNVSSRRRSDHDSYEPDNSSHYYDSRDNESSDGDILDKDESQSEDSIAPKKTKKKNKKVSGRV